jgi:hypothetical protein
MGKIKFFSEFFNESTDPGQVPGKDYAATALDALAKAYADPRDPKVEWVEPVHKGRLSMPEPEDGRQEGSLVFDVGTVSLSVDYEVYNEVKPGWPGDYNTPPDPDEVSTTDITVNLVSLSEDGSEVAEFKSGEALDGAWLLLYKLLDYTSASVVKKASTLKTKLNWK